MRHKQKPKMQLYQLQHLRKHQLRKKHQLKKKLQLKKKHQLKRRLLKRKLHLQRREENPRVVHPNSLQSKRSANSTTQLQLT